MPSHHRRGRVPTRLAAKQQSTGDRFNTIVYHIDECDRFLIIDYRARPEPYDWVLISEPNSEEITLALYDGQLYSGVARMLEFYQLTQSEQWRPQIRSRFTNWLILFALPFWADFIFGMIQ